MPTIKVATKEIKKMRRVYSALTRSITLALLFGVLGLLISLSIPETLHIKDFTVPSSFLLFSLIMGVFLLKLDPKEEDFMRAFPFLRDFCCENCGSFKTERTSDRGHKHCKNCSHDWIRAE